MGVTIKTQVVNGMDKLIYFKVINIDVSNQATCVLTDMVLCDEEGGKITVGNPCTAYQRRSDHFLSFMMMIRMDQSDQKFQYSFIICGGSFKLPLD